MTHHLVGAAEIASILGVSRQRVSQIAAFDEDFPAPEVELASGRVWRREAIEEWARSRQARHQGGPRMERLLDQELAVVDKLQQGRTLREAESELAIPHRTMRRHLANIVDKLTAVLEEDQQ